MNTRQRYPSDLTDAQWALLEPLVPAVKEGGRSATYSRREIVNGILFVTRTGCAWRYMPHDLPPWSLVYYYFWNWREAGVWEKISEQLRADLREKLGRNRHPSAAVIDSQTVKTTEKGGDRGFDGGKLITGHKRHLLVDTQGFLLRAIVTAANIADSAAARCLLLFSWIFLPRLQLVWADAGYRGTLIEWAKRVLGWRVDIVPPPQQGKGFVLAPRRWVVERTFAWLGRCRRLGKDYEQTIASSEAFIYIAMMGLMVRRLART